jgi:formylmethanofuran dehydrogenase subunit D
MKRLKICAGIRRGNRRVSNMPKLRISLLTGRTIGQGIGKEYGKLSEEYQQSVATCEIDPNDMNRLGVRENDNVRVSTDFGSIVVKAIESARSPHPEVVFIPYGPWANRVVDPRTHGTGMPSLKGIPAEIEPAPDREVLRLPELLQIYYGTR